MPAPHATRRRFLAGAAAAIAAAAMPRAAWAQVAASLPRARIEPVVDALWGERIVDPYRWMETPSDPDWLPFVRGQDAYARATINALPERARLLARIRSLSGDITQVVYPRPAGGIRFVQQREAGAATYRIVAHHGDGRQQVLADPALLDPAAQAPSITWWLPSPDGRYLALGLAAGGSEAATGYVIETASGRVLPDRLADVQYAAPAWLPDASGFFYNRLAGRPAGNPAFYNYRSLWLHRIGSGQGDDRRIVGGGDAADVTMQAISSPELQVGIGGRHAALLIRDGYVRSFALYLAPLDALLAGRADWRRICGPEDGIADLALTGDTLYLVSTAAAANGALLTLDAATGTLATATVAAPAGDLVLDKLNAAPGGVYVTVNDGGEQRLRFQPIAGPGRDVALPYAGWVQNVGVDPRDGTALIRITSWLQPGRVFAVDSRTGDARPTSLQAPPRIDLAPYEYRRIMVTARDGVRVPLSLLRRRGPIRAAPCLVHAYGAYQWPSQPVFDARAIAFLESGGVIATAHVRGGGEYGRAWHRAGMQATKPNSWRDLIDCCGHLVATGQTRPTQLAVIGGSAGGITVGRAMTERPDLFGAVISKVGMSNPLRAEFEPNGQPNIPEFGSVKTEAGFRTLTAMDSYHAVQDGTRYPAMLLETAANDVRVAPHNAAKMAARLQAADPGGTTLLRVDFDGGHNSNDLSKEKADAEYADEFAFVLAAARRAFSRLDHRA